jgi:hypothetical protein
MQNSVSFGNCNISSAYRAGSLKGEIIKKYVCVCVCGAVNRAHVALWTGPVWGCGSAHLAVEWAKRIAF